MGSWREMGAGYERRGESIEGREEGGGGGESMAVRRKEGHSKKAKGTERQGSERGKQKERRKREGRACGQRGARKTSRVRGEAWPCDGQQKKRKKKREREKGAHGHRKSGALHSHAKSSDGGGVFTPWRCRNQTHPGSLQITATDNKQLFTCWTRAGDETKVLCQRSKCASEQTHSSLQTPTSKRVPLNEFTFFYLWPFRRLGHTQCRVNLIRSVHTFK